VCAAHAQSVCDSKVSCLHGFLEVDSYKVVVVTVKIEYSAVMMMVMMMMTMMIDDDVLLTLVTVRESSDATPTSTTQATTSASITADTPTAQPNAGESDT